MIVSNDLCKAWASDEANLQRGLMICAIKRTKKNKESRTILGLLVKQTDQYDYITNMNDTNKPDARAIHFKVILAPVALPGAEMTKWAR